MKHLGLFAGIGGFELAARWMGWETVAWVEWNEFCQKVLKYHFPEAEGHSDITKTDFTKYKNAIDIITGGFPCQPYSVAGEQKGTDDERHLWPEMLRAIREITPTWVVGENVRGLVSWSGGLVFEQVQLDLENEGYEVLPCLLPAASVGAPHERYRIWFVAHKNTNPIRCNGKVRKKESSIRQFRNSVSGNNERLQIHPGKTRNDFNPDKKRCKEFNITKEPKRQELSNRGLINDWSNWPIQSPIRYGNDGLPTGLDGTTLSGWEFETIAAGGNAIVPQVAHQIFKAIEQFMKPVPG